MFAAMEMVIPESPSDRLVRYAAATLALAAGVVHLGQIGPHLDEDPLFGIFFFVVGLLQFAGGIYLVRPVGSARLTACVAWFGIGGSLATIAIWSISRTMGLPFGAEPGSPETVGLADAAADLFELFTALLLLIWLRPPWSPRLLGPIGALGALGLALLWLATRGLGRFDPDPRLVLSSEYVDAAAVGSLLILAALLRRSAPRRTNGAPPRRTSHALVAALAITAASLVVFTLPARGGQNRDCAYAPIREDSRLSHARPAVPIPLAIGALKSVVVLYLVACADEPVELLAVQALGPLPGTGDIVAITVDRSRPDRGSRVRDGTSGEPVRGQMLRPGAGRYPVVVTVGGRAPGDLPLYAFRVEYRFKERTDSMGFASTALLRVR